MLKREQYNLVFNKHQLFDPRFNNRVYYTCECKGIWNDDNFMLHFIGRFDAWETGVFIRDLDECILHRINGNSGYYTDCVEDLDIAYAYPNVTVDDFTISMVDLRELLQEWLDFISAE